MNVFNVSDMCIAISNARGKINKIQKMPLSPRNMDAIDISESKKDVVKKLLDETLPKIKNQITVCGNIADKYSNWAANSSDYRAAFLTRMKNLDKINAESASLIKALDDRIINMNEERRKCEENLSQAVRELNKKKNDLEKYCWVPFYNLYLLEDYEDAVNSWKRKYKDVNREISELRQELSEKMESRAKVQVEDENAHTLLKLFESQEKELTQRLDQAKHMVLEWNQTYDFFVKLKSDLETLDNYENLLKNANDHLEEVSKIEATIDYSVLEITTYYMGDYHIKNYNGSCCGISDDSRMIVSHNDSDSRTIFSLVTLTNGAVMIINDELKLATYKDKQQICFENIRLNGDYMATEQSYYITKYGDNDSQVRIGASKEADAICMDIDKSNYSDGTIILTWSSHNGNNQRFILEKVG